MNWCASLIGHLRIGEHLFDYISEAVVLLILEGKYGNASKLCFCDPS